MKENKRAIEVRTLTNAFFELQAIKHAGFNYVVSNNREEAYLAAFYYRADAEFFRKMVNDTDDSIEYEVWHVDALMSEVDDDACALLYDEE